jgi:hypothetical protein
VAKFRQSGNTLSGSATGQTLQVRGLAQLQRDLGKVAKTARTEVRTGLKDVGSIVSRESKMVAAQKGLRGKTGKLIARIVPTVRAQGVFVEAKATNKGYRYPGVYEFGGRAAQANRRGPGMTAIKNRSSQGAALMKTGSALGAFGEYGPRAFLWPALMNKQNEVERAMEYWLDTFLSGNDL